MNYTEIGHTGVKIPPIIFGTSALGNLYRELDEETKLEIVKECLQNMKGPAVFDSAGKYGAGLALEKLGEKLKQLKASPESIVISNKLGWLRTPLTTSEPDFEKGVWMNIGNNAELSISYEGIMECWEQGNELLGGTYKPQLLSVHDPDEYLESSVDESERKIRFGNILEAYRALSDLKADGQIKAIGIGAKNWKVIEEIEAYVNLDWVMFANSMTILKHPADLLNFMQRLANKSIAIVNSAIFHAGFLTGGNYFDYVAIKPDTATNKSLFKWRESFFNLCRQFDVPPATVCVNFAMTAPGVISISLNTSNSARIKDNIESVEAQVPGDFWKEMVNGGLISSDYPYLK